MAATHIKPIGIGLAYVEAAVKAGAKAVVIADLRLTKEAKQVVTSTKEVTFQECDVTKWKDLQNLIDVSLKEYGDVPDIYAVAAGVFEPVSLSILAKQNTSNLTSAVLQLLGRPRIA